MGINKKQPPAQKGKRISLVRQGEKPVRNTRRKEVSKHEQASFNLSGLNGVLSIAAVGFGCFALCVLAGFILIYSYRHATTTNYFALKTIGIHGQERLSSKEVLEAAGLNTGGNVLALSIDLVEERISALPWVDEVAVQRVLPDGLIVALKERRPVFWSLKQGKMHYADAAGQVIAPVRSENFLSLPILEVEKEAEVAKVNLEDITAAIGQIAWPEGLQTIAKIRLSSSQNVEVFFTEKPLHVFIGLEELSANIERLSLVVADLQRRGEIDVVRKIKAQGANVWVHKENSAVLGG